jgi:hypothetical protein
MKKFSIWLKENKNWFEDSSYRISSIPQQQTAQVATTPKAPPQAPPTVTYVPQGATNNVYHDHPIVNKLLDIVKNKVDHLTWDYGKDSVQMAIASALDSVPHMKSQCDRITGCWQKFKDALYKELKENEVPWWGPPRQGSPNPAKYDVALMNLKDIEKIFQEMKELCSQCDKAELNQLFLSFLEEYEKVMPGLKSQIEVFRKNTPRK